MRKKKDKNIDVSHLDSADKTILIHMLQEQLNLLEERYDRMAVKLKMLEGKNAKNSKNSSKPPSSDDKPGSRPKKTTSSKKKSGKSVGGQPGHKGSHLEMSNSPDEIVNLKVKRCIDCNHDLSDVKADIEKRQEFEIPQPRMWVIEYQSEYKHCSHCGSTTQACFPDEVTHKAQYGPRAKSLMVYMSQYQLLPFHRASEFFNAVYGCSVSPGTIVNAVSAIGERYTQIDEQIKSFLSQTKVAHADETSMNVNGQKYWLHTVGNVSATHYALHEKRGRKATEHIGILPEFKGTLVHDHWKSYFTYEDCQHALCNAHHLRELRYINEHQNIKWAKDISNLLVLINEEKEKLPENSRFSKRRVTTHIKSYDDILQKGKKEQAKRGTIDSHNLHKRLVNFKDEVLRFMTDIDVPFTNNLSERDIRMNKVKQKISGCFRKVTGSDNFCKIRSVLSTAAKNNKNIFEVLQLSFQEIISLNQITSDSG